MSGHQGGTTAQRTCALIPLPPLSGASCHRRRVDISVAPSIGHRALRQLWGTSGEKPLVQGIDDLTTPPGRRGNAGDWEGRRSDLAPALKPHHKSRATIGDSRLDLELIDGSRVDALSSEVVANDDLLPLDREIELERSNGEDRRDERHRKRPQIAADCDGEEGNGDYPSTACADHAHGHGARDRRRHALHSARYATRVQV
jgi:hypothetical protein